MAGSLDDLIDWGDEFPLENTPGVSAYLDEGFNESITISFIAIAPANAEEIGLRMQAWMGATTYYDKPMVPGENLIEFSSVINSGYGDTLRILAFSDGSTVEVLTIPERPSIEPWVDDRNWTNVFDVGPCRVELQDWGRVVPPEEYGGWGIESIEVIDGEIVVTSVEGGSIQGLQFAVVPEFPTNEAPVRVIGQRWQFNNGYGYNIIAEMVLKRGGDSLWDTVVYPEQGEGFPDAEVNPDPAELSRGGVAWDTVLLGGSSG